MPTSAKSFLKRFSFSSRNPQPPPPLPPPPPPLPAAFLCPISTLLMADPIVVPSGHSIDRPCIQACRDLSITPPHLHLNLTLDFPLIPNLNLRDAITDYCQTSGYPPPTPISPDSALQFVRRLMSSPPPPTIDPPPYSSFDSVKEQRFLNTLYQTTLSTKASAFTTLIAVPFCSPRVLAAIIFFLTNPDNRLQELASEAIHTLSKNPANRTHILRCGAVPPLISLLPSGSLLAAGTTSASGGAAGTLYELSREEQNRLALSALGAVSPLLTKFCEHVSRNVGWKEAALALYNLSHSCRRNLEVLVHMGGVYVLIEVSEDEASSMEMRMYALVLLHCLVGLRRGREEVMTAGGIEVLLKLVKEREGVGVCSLAVMYKVCRGSLGRFREVAAAARGEEVLVREVEEWGENEKEMAREMVRVMRGEVDEGKKLKKIAVEFGEGVLMEKVVEEEEEEEEEEGKKVVSYG